MEKPPLGLIPRYIHREQRVDDIKSAILRFMERNYPIPKKWIKEYNELIKKPE